MAFPFVPAILGLGGLGLVSALVTVPSSNPVPKTLKPYAWYRLRLKTPVVPGSPEIPLGGSRVLVFDRFAAGSIVPFAVSDAVKALGFDTPIFAMGDAQNGSLWDVFAQFLGGGPSDLMAAGVIQADQVLSTSPFAGSIPILNWIGPFKRRVSNDPTADGLMDPSLKNAASIAVTHDTDETRLNNFSISLLPDFPSVSGILKAKTAALRVARANRYSLDPVLALNAPPSQTRIGDIWDVTAFILTGGASEAIPVIVHTVSDAIDLIADIGRTILEVVKTVAPFIQIGLSFIPGIGTVASAALGAGIALAEGRPISDVLIAAAKGAFPGGPLAVAAIDAGLHAIANLAQGESLGDSLLQGIRQGIGDLDPTAQMAFDATIALAQGKKIQDVATTAVGAISPEAGAVLGAIADGKPVNASLLAQAASARAGLPVEAQNAFASVTALAQMGNLTDAAATIARSKLPAAGRPAFDAAYAIARKQDARAAVIQGARALAPQTQEAQAALAMTSTALRGGVTPATLTGEAAKFIPNAPAGIRGTPALSELTAQEAQRISNQGTKAFAHPVLYLPRAQREAIEEQSQTEINDQIQAEKKNPITGRAKFDQALTQSYTRAMSDAAKLHAANQIAWIPIYENLQLTMNRGGIPPL